MCNITIIPQMTSYMTTCAELHLISRILPLHEIYIPTESLFSCLSMLIFVSNTHFHIKIRWKPEATAPSNGLHAIAPQEKTGVPVEKILVSDSVP